MSNSLDTATFVLSLDFELAWGMRDLGPEGFQHDECTITRKTVVPALLELFERYELPASWCTVGQLFDTEIAHPSSEHFAQLTPPDHAWVQKPWYEGVPSGNEFEIPDYLAPSLIKKIQQATPAQEIGCHSFSHTIFGDPGCSRACAKSELAACVQRAQRLGVDLQSMVFPRNSVGHLDLLKEHGFLCYRGPEERRFLPHIEDRKLEKVAHITSILSRRYAYPVMPVKDHHGLWNIPSSMMLFPANGWRARIPMSFRVRRAERGIDDAVAQRQVFHIWFHPINLAHKTQELLGALESILRHAQTYKEQGRLRFMSMGQLARECEDRLAPPRAAPEPSASASSRRITS